MPMEVLGECWSRSASCLYDWQRALLLYGLDRLVSRHSGGCRSQLPSGQKQCLGELMEAGLLVGGCGTACWNSVLIRGLSWGEYGVLDNRHYVCTLLHNLSFSFHKARLVSEPLDEAKRLAGGAMAGAWPYRQALPRSEP